MEASSRQGLRRCLAPRSGANDAALAKRSLGSFLGGLRRSFARSLRGRTDSARFWRIQGVVRPLLACRSSHHAARRRAGEARPRRAALRAPAHCHARSGLGAFGLTRGGGVGEGGAGAARSGAGRARTGSREPVADRDHVGGERHRAQPQRGSRTNRVGGLQAPTLFVIARSLDVLQIDARVDESDVGHVATGQPVSFVVDAYPGQTLRRSPRSALCRNSADNSSSNSVTPGRGCHD